MSSRLRSLVLFTAFLPATLSAQEPAREHLLRIAIPAGNVQFHRKTVTVERTGADATVRTITMEITLETRVSAVAEGKSSVEQTVRRVVSKATGPGAHSYDSDAGGEDPGFGSMVGKSMRMKLDERGGTSDVQLSEGLSQERSEPWFMQGLQFAAAPVGVGKTWEVRCPMVIPEVSGTSGVLVHKLIAVDKGRATIETQVKVDKDNKDSKDNLQLPAGMALEKNGGTAVIELASGKLLESRSELVWSVTNAAGKKSVKSMTTSVQAIEPPAKQAGAKAEPTGGKN